MAEVNVEFSVIDKFSKQMDEFEERLKKLEGSSGKVDKSINSVGKSADGAGGLFKGFGGAMFLVNQAMQAFVKIADNVKGALDDIAYKERAIVMLGEDAGVAMAEFAKQSARSLGRSQSEIMKNMLKFRETGMGGSDMMEMSKLADRFARLNPGKSYDEVAQALNDAVKSKDVGALADLLGGGEGVEKKLTRKGVERDLRRGDVAGAMEKFKDVADVFGYTQDAADKMGRTISQKVDHIIDRVKTKTTELFSGLVQKAEPYIDKVMEWLDSEEVDIFFDNLQTTIWNTVDFIGSAIDAITDAVGSVWDTIHGVFNDVVGESTSTMEMLVGVFVGGVTQIGGSIWNAVAILLDKILLGTQGAINGIIDAGIGLRNFAVSVAYGIKDTVLNVITDIIDGAARAVEYVADNPIGKFLGIDSAVSDLDSFNQKLNDLKGGATMVDSVEHHVDFSDAMLKQIDSVGQAAENIESVMNFLKDFSIDHRDINAEKAVEILGKIKPDVSKIKGTLLHEQDLRWLKERAEQRYVNNINFRQLTPTINVKVEGGNVTPIQVERTIKKVLDQQASAGTFNVYGEG